MMKIESQLKAFLTLAAALTSVAAFAETAEKPAQLNGFVDAQVFGSSNSGLTQGFVINSGEVAASKEVGRASALINIPFSVSGTGANFNVGLARAQAFVAYNYDFGLRWKLGQFDTIFGFELNHAPDITFARQGLVYSAANPVGHTGLLASYELMKGTNFNFLVGNPQDQGLLGGNNLQYSAQITYAPESVRLAAGGSLFKLGTETLLYGNFLAGVTLGSLALDGELALKGLAADAGTGAAILGNAVYGITEMVNVGVRGEYANKLTGATLTNGYVTQGAKQLQITVGPQFNMTKELKVKLDYTYLNDRSLPAAENQNLHFYALAAVYKL